VGTADVGSVPGRPGLLDADVVVRAAETIQNECRAFTDPVNSHTQVLPSSTVRSCLLVC